MPQKHVLLDLASLYLEILFPCRLVGPFQEPTQKVHNRNNIIHLAGPVLSTNLTSPPEPKPQILAQDKYEMQPGIRSQHRPLTARVGAKRGCGSRGVSTICPAV